MSARSFSPRRLDQSFSRLAYPAALKSLLLANNPAYCHYFDDFQGDALNAQYPANVGTGTQVVGVTEAVNGTATLTTGANAADSAGQHYWRHWNGTNGFYYICRFQQDTITLAKFEVGLNDAITGDTGMVATKATPTHTGTSYAVMCRDTNDDSNVTFISAAAGAAGANADWGGTFAAGTYFIAEIVGAGAFVSGYMNGQYVGGGAITAGTAVTPWIYTLKREAVARTLTVDYQGIMGPRA